VIKVFSAKNYKSLKEIEIPLGSLAVAEMLISASSRTQALVTTHSPYLIDFIPPESIVIVENKNAQTVLKEVRKDKRRQEAIKSLGAGRAWYGGHLGGVP